MLIIAPRRPERFDEVGALARDEGLRVLRRTELVVDTEPAADVVILDSISRAGVGDLNENQPVNRAIDMLNRLAPTWLAIAHTPRADETHVYGSVHFEAGEDLGVGLIAQTSMDGLLTGVGLRVDKANDLPKNIPLGIHAMEWDERGVIVLCRTSNPGGSDLQFLNADGVPLYQHVARLVAEKWNKNGQCALVVGATFPQELAAVRAIVGDMPLLVPGVGAQGGDVAATVRSGRTASGAGMMINSSRAILYAAPQGSESFADAARRVALETRDAINAYR